LFATSIIAQTAIWHLQPQIIVVVLTLWSFERYAAGKPIAAGVILAFAGGLKIAPAAFGVIFLLDRNWRAAIAAALTGAVLLALSFLVGGLQLHLDFLEGAAAASEGIFFTRITYTVEMALYALGMWAGYLPFVDTSDAVERIMHTPPAISVAVKALALAAFGWVIWRTYRLPADIRLPAQIILLTLIINGFGPLGWSHYYLPIILFLPALFGLMSRTSGITLAILFAVVTSSPAQLWMREHWVNETVVGVVHTGLMALIFVALILSLKRHEPPLSA
ncbi:MAG: glycosyltransferase family 87 protein, partial [Pseudomonadota bacterium]